MFFFSLPLSGEAKKRGGRNGKFNASFDFLFSYSKCVSFYQKHNSLMSFLLFSVCKSFTDEIYFSLLFSSLAKPTFVTFIDFPSSLPLKLPYYIQNVNFMLIHSVRTAKMKKKNKKDNSTSLFFSTSYRQKMERYYEH